MHPWPHPPRFPVKQLAWQVGRSWAGGRGLSPRMGQGSSKQGQPGCAAIRRVSGKATFSCHFGQMFNDVLVEKKSGGLNLFPFPFFLQTLWSLFLRLCLIWGFTVKSWCQDRDPVSWSEAQLLAAQRLPLACGRQPAPPGWAWGKRQRSALYRPNPNSASFLPLSLLSAPSSVGTATAPRYAARNITSSCKFYFLTQSASSTLPTSTAACTTV